MKQKLTNQDVKILHTRIYVSRETRLFNLSDLAKEWKISDPTLFRYASPEERALSRQAALRTTMLLKNTDRTRCQLCPLKLFSHPRCASCTMLIHGIPECSCFALRAD